VRRRLTAPRRKIDREHAYLRFAEADNAQAAAVQFADWARVPASSFDNVQQLEIDSGLTLIFTRLIWHLQLSSVSNAIGSIAQQLDFGVIAWPGTAGDAIPAEVPTPRDSTAPWVWRHHEALYVPFPSAASSNTWAHNLQGPNEQVVSRAMRKLPDIVGLLFVLEWSWGGAGSNVSSVSVDLRADIPMTLKLP